MMAAQSNSSQEQTNAKAKDEKSGNFSLKKSMPNFSSGDEDEELLAPSPVFLKFSRPRGKPKYRHENKNETMIKDDTGLCKASSATCSPLTKSRVRDVIEFSSMLKPRAVMGDSFSDEISCFAASKANQNCELDVSEVKRKKKRRNVMRDSNTSSDTSPDSGLMEKARKYSQKIGSKMREEKKAIAKQYFHDLLHSCDQNIEEDENLKDTGQEHGLAHKKKRKAEMACGISHSRQEEQEYPCQVEKSHKKKRSKVAQKYCSDGRNALNEEQSDKADRNSSKFFMTPNSETSVHSNSSSDAKVISEKRTLRDMLSIDGVDQRPEKPQRRCRQSFYLNIPKELQWPSASESDSEEDIVNVHTVCSRKQHKSPRGCPGNAPGHCDPENSMQTSRRRNNECSPIFRRASSKQCQNMISQHQGDRENVHSLYNEQMWLYNSANISEGATAMHSSLVKNINADQCIHKDVEESNNVNSREKHHLGQNDPSSDQKNKVLDHNVSVISKSDDESISGESDILEENSLDGSGREAFPIRRSQRFMDRRDCRWSSFERRETENPLIPSPEFLQLPQNPLLVARLTSHDCAGQRSASRSSVKGRPLRPNRNCRQRHEVTPSPRSQRMFQTVNQMDGDEEMARRLQEEMDFEYAMTLHNAENQAPAPPCPRLSEYHSHDNDSPTMMLTRGMRQATRDMDIVLESLFHEEAEDSSTENPMIDFPFGPHMLVSHGVNRRGNRSRGRRHDWTERLLTEELQQGRNNIPRRILSHSRTFSSNDYEDLLSIAELLGDVKPKGISSDEMNLLPEKKFHPNNKITSCSICMCDYILNERLKILPCFHEFHGECIEKWIVTNATCPICRVEVKL